MFTLTMGFGISTVSASMMIKSHNQFVQAFLFLDTKLNPKFRLFQL